MTPPSTSASCGYNTPPAELNFLLLFGENAAFFSGGTDAFGVYLASTIGLRLIRRKHWFSPRGTGERRRSKRIGAGEAWLGWSKQRQMGPDRCESGRGHAEHNLTQLPRCSRPMTSGSQCVNAYSEISRPRALSPARFHEVLDEKTLPGHMCDAVAGLEAEMRIISPVIGGHRPS